MRRTMDTVCAALLGLLVAGCSDAVAPQGEWAAPRSPFVVSAPHVSPTSAVSVAYVALPPWSIRGADVISILGPSGKFTVASSHADGLDPVAVPAVAGDTLRISVTTAYSAVPTTYVEVVPSTRRPSVIRTFPQASATDVRLEAQIGVVFSAPIAEASLSPASLRLMQGATPVPARIVFGTRSPCSTRRPQDTTPTIATCWPAACRTCASACTAADRSWPVIPPRSRSHPTTPSAPTTWCRNARR